MASLSSDPLFSSGQSNLHRINEQLAAFPSSSLASTDRDKLNAIISNLGKVLDQPLAPSSSVKQDLLEIGMQIKRLDPEAFRELGDKLNGLYLLAELGGGGGVGIQLTILSYLPEAAPTLASLAPTDMAFFRKNPEAFAKWIRENKIPFGALVRELKLSTAEVDTLASAFAKWIRENKISFEAFARELKLSAAEIDIFAAFLPTLDLIHLGQWDAEHPDEIMKRIHSAPEIPLKNVKFNPNYAVSALHDLFQPGDPQEARLAFAKLSNGVQLQALKCAFCNSDNSSRLQDFYYRDSVIKGYLTPSPDVEAEHQERLDALANPQELFTAQETVDILRQESSMIRSLRLGTGVGTVLLKDWTAFNGKAGDALITYFEHEAIRALPPEQEAEFRAV